MVCLILLQAILQSYALNSPDDIIRYARWTLTIMAIILQRGNKGDEQKGVDFVAKARDILRTPIGKKVISSVLVQPLTLTQSRCIRPTKLNGFWLRHGIVDWSSSSEQVDMGRLSY